MHYAVTSHSKEEIDNWSNRKLELLQLSFVHRTTQNSIEANWIL